MIRISMLLIIVLVLSIFIPLDSFAAEAGTQISINGKIVQFNDTTGSPFVDESGRTQVPFRITLETFGAKVDWSNSTRTAIAEKDGIIVEVPIGAKYISKNGNKWENDTVACIKDGKTYLPIRKVMEAFGCHVDWDTTSKTVTIENIKNKDILMYNIPKALGIPKLSKQEIEKLVGEEPGVIQSKISTIPDLLQYMISAKYANDDSGDTKIKEGSFTWHFNRPSESTIKVNKGNCGATANLANFILKNDYEEVGIVNFSADTGQGGHVFNYIKNNGKYYIIDFLQYVMSDYKRYNYKILELDKLEEYPEYCMRSYGNGGEKYQIKIIVAYMAENQMPIANKASGSERVMRFFPKGGNVKVLYETPTEGKLVEFVDGPSKEPNWNN